MSIKYNEFGEVISVNGLTTGQHLGTPMQDAIAEKPEDNAAYGEELRTVTRAENTVDDAQPSAGGIDLSNAETITEMPEGAGYLVLVDGVVKLYMPLPTFTVWCSGCPENADGHPVGKFSFEIGMTLGEWFESEYNTLGGEYEPQPEENYGYWQDWSHCLYVDKGHVLVNGEEIYVDYM